MTTNTITETTSEHHPLRVIALALGLVAVVVALVLIPTNANAATVWINTNDRYNSTFEIGGARLPSGLCSIAMGGVDKNTGDELLLTVGHCGTVGTVVTKNEWTVIGEFIFSQSTFSKAGDMGKVDVGVIKLRKNVHVMPTGRTIGSPKLGDRIVRRGNDLGFKTKFHGKITMVTETDFNIDTFGFPGASGGTNELENSSTVVGLTSRVYEGFLVPVTTVMRADYAANFVKSAGIDFKLV